ncbi:RNA exonuclease 4-like [Ciona intestinalis]
MVRSKKRKISDPDKNVNSNKVKIPKCSANWKVLESQIIEEKKVKEAAEKEEEKIKKRKIDNVSSEKQFKRRDNKLKPSRNINNNSNGIIKKKKTIAEDIWFDGVDASEIMDLENGEDVKVIAANPAVQNKLVKKDGYSGITRIVAMDCEMVGVGDDGRDSVLARVSLVNQFGKCIYDKHVKAREDVTDYRTFVSGIRPADLVNAEDFEVVQKEVAEIIEGRILVGHALWNDFQVLFLNHPKKCIRDTAKYKPFRNLTAGRSPGLRILCKKILGVDVQKGEHSSVQDAQAAMRLYTMHKKHWEAQAYVKLNKKVKKKQPNN